MRRRPGVRRLAVALLSVLGSSGAAAGWDYETSLAAGWHQVTERDDGRTLVQEEGFGAAFDGVLIASTGGWRFDLSGGFEGASLDYDGQTQLGAELGTETDWVGWHAGAGVDRRFQGPVPFRLGVGLDYQWRRRGIRATDSVSGLEETYRSVWLGIRGSVRPARFSLVQANAGCAVVSNVDVDLPGDFDAAELSLGDHCRAGLAIEIGLGRPAGRELFVRPFARWERYPESDPERLTAGGTGVGTIYLPRTELVSFGISVGLRRRQQ